jgi:peptide/nickel transport system substrate-binding protein
MTISRRALIASASAVAVSSRSMAQPAAHTRFTVRMDSALASMDPAFRPSPLDGSVMWAIFQKLVRFKPGSVEWELDAAEHIRQVSDTVVEFTLRPGQMFTDGYGAMTAEDVKFSFERIARGARESPYKSDWVNLDQVDVTGPLTGRIVMKQPTAYLWDISLPDGSGCIVSKAAWEKLGDKVALAPVGSGPYHITSMDPQQRVVLAPNPGYAGLHKPDWAEITVRIVPDPKTAELAYRAGELDFTSLTPSTVVSMRNAPDTHITQSPGLRFIWLSLNVDKKPLNDPRVRQAIALGLDIDQILLAGYNGLAPRANALIQPQVLGYWKDAPVSKRDVAAAKRLLAEAGVPSPSLRLTMLNQPAFQTMGLVAQAQLAEIGVQLQLDVRDAGTYWSSGKGDAGKDLDMVLMRFNGKLDPNFNTQWFTSSQVGVWNWSRWRSPEFDKINAAAGTELDKAKRADLIVQCQTLMAESAAFIWLTYDVDLFAAKSWLKPAIMPTGSDWQLSQFSLV